MIAKWLLLTTFALSLYATGQVWLVQLSSYPLWAHVGHGDFKDYHRAWWRSIWGVVLVPSVLTALCSVLMSLVGRARRASLGPLVRLGLAGCIRPRHDLLVGTADGATSKLQAAASTRTAIAS